MHTEAILSENQDQYYKRVSNLLKHKKRPVTKSDYEQFLLNSFNITRFEDFEINPTFEDAVKGTLIAKKNNIDTSNIIISDKHKTGVAGIHVDRNTGKNSITVVRGAPSSLTINEINSDLIAQSKIFLTQLEVPLDVTLHCLKIAKKNGLINILNPITQFGSLSFP